MTDLVAKTAMDRRLADIVQPVIEGLGFELVRIRLMGGATRTLQIMADKPEGGIEVDDCGDISTAVSAVLDVEDPIEENYVLEVSSPGIDRPLTRAKDFAKWAGHEANFSLKEPVGDHRKLRGELLGLEGEIVAVEDRKAGRVEVALGNIHSAKLVLTDKLIAATKPIDMTGADEIEETEEEKAED